LQNSLPHRRCIRLYLPQRRIARLIQAAKAAHLLLKEKAFIVLRFVRNLDVLPSYRYPLRLIHALNQRPRGTPILIGAGRVQHDRGGNLAFIRTVQAFTCHGAERQCRLPVLFNRLLRHTGSLLPSLYALRYCLTASAGFGRQFAKLRALSRLRRRYDSRKKRSPLSAALLR